MRVLSTAAATAAPPRRGTRLLRGAGAALVAALAAAAPTAPAAETGPLVFLGNRNIPPVVYLEGDAPAGVAVDLVRALAVHLPRPVEIRATDWTAAQAQVLRGEADALIQMNPSPERRALYDFSQPLLESRFSIFTRADTTGISGARSLRGLRVGVEAAGLPRQVLSADPAVQLRTIPDFRRGFEMLQQGEVDAVVVDLRVGAYVIARGGLRNLKVTGDPIAFSSSAIAVRRGNAELLAQIDAALQAIRADGTYDRVLARWRPKEVVFWTREQLDRTLAYAAIAGLLVLLLLAGAWTAVLLGQLRRRRSAELQLLERNAMLDRIIGGVDAAIFALDRSLRYTAFNARHAEEMRAIQGADVALGRSLPDLLGDSPDRPGVVAALERALAGEPSAMEGYSRAAHRPRQYYRVSYGPLRSAHGDVFGVVVLAQDLTESRRAEETIRRLNRDLTAQFEAARQELESFAYSVSHDLRAPIRHIDGFAGLLQRQLGGEVDDRARGYITAISESARAMGQLIDNLLSFSRMGRAALARAPVPLGALVDEVVADLAAEAAGREVRWSIGALPTVSADRALLRVAIASLLSNALKFTRARRPAEIEVGCGAGEPGETVVFVRDNGVGFDPAYGHKLFGVFQRLHRAEEFEGSGIGLANVHRILARHGGRTWAEGEVGRGATFYVALPTTPPEA